MKIKINRTGSISIETWLGLVLRLSKVNDDYNPRLLNIVTNIKG